MPSGPSRRLEAFVGLLIPPACREEVLGDLHEKYTGTWQYISLAMCVVPCVILSRIRRTTDLFVLLTDALLIYGSFLAATWNTDKMLSAGHRGLLWLAVPTVLNLALLILERVWDFDYKTRWARALFNGAVIAIGIYFSFWGEMASVLLVWAVESAFRRRANLPQAAAEPVLGLKQRPDSAAAKSFFAKFSTAVAVIFILEGIIRALTGVRPAILDTVAIVVGVVGLQLRRSAKR